MQAGQASASYETHDGVAVVALDNAPVNALSAAVRAHLASAVAAANADAAVRAIVLVGKGKVFSGGADITEFGRQPVSPSLQEVIDAVEGSGKPVIAAVHGIALGGGLELALACHARVATRDAKLGLPEVKLGLLPGAGGTQRLPRVVGVEAALDMIVSGEPIDGATAQARGLVDALADGDVIAAAVAHADEAGRATLARDRTEAVEAARRDEGLFERYRAANARRFRGFEAPARCLEAVRASVNMPFEAGIAEERRLFLEAMDSTQSKAQRHAFFAERQAAKIADLPAGTTALPIRKVGIIGAGTMGGGIAMNFLSAGIETVIVEARQEALDRGLKTIRRNYDATAKKGRITAADVETRMGLLASGIDMSALADCDLVIEAVFEDMAVKKEVFARLDAIAKPGAILASNTSYLDIDEIAQATSRPGHVIGLHFFSPANVMRLLEVVRGRETEPAIIATAMSLAKTIGKVAVLVRVCHGFVGNRMLGARQREANKLILEGAAPADVDRVCVAYGMPMGPFQMADLAGLDIGWSKERSASATVRDILCEQGRLGQKSGSGFYDYDEARRATPSPVALAAIETIAAKEGIERRAISDEEIFERCTFPLINEGAKILEEGVAQRASDIDVVWVNGYGWPVYRGGPMFDADVIGPARILERMREYEARFGTDFAPAALLVTLAETNGRFLDR